MTIKNDVFWKDRHVGYGVPCKKVLPSGITRITVWCEVYETCGSVYIRLWMSREFKFYFWVISPISSKLHLHGGVFLYCTVLSHLLLQCFSAVNHAVVMIVVRKTISEYPYWYISLHKYTNSLVDRDFLLVAVIHRRIIFWNVNMS